jgi:hypothetical protein
MTRIEAELGGITSDRPMQAGVSYVPVDMELHDGAIHWNLDRVKEVRPGAGLLVDFVQLSDWEEKRILEYARKWGVLGICCHHLPCSHSNYPFGGQFGVQSCRPFSSHRRGYLSADPIEDWRRLSRRVRAVQDLGAHLNQGKTGAKLDWTLVTSNDWIKSEKRTVAEGRLALAQELNNCLSIGQVRPGVSWDRKKGQWQIEFGAHSVPNLFGLISLNLLLSISGRDLVICSSCPRSYVPQRRPDPGRRNYCPVCSHRAAQRDASRDYRMRQKLSNMQRLEKIQRKAPDRFTDVPRTQGRVPSSATEPDYAGQHRAVR